MVTTTRFSVGLNGFKSFELVIVDKCDTMQRITQYFISNFICISCVHCTADPLKRKMKLKLKMEMKIKLKTERHLKWGRVRKLKTYNISKRWTRILVRFLHLILQMSYVKLTLDSINLIHLDAIRIVEMFYFCHIIIAIKRLKKMWNHLI